MSHTCTVVCRCLVVRGRARSFARLFVFLSVVSPLVCSLVSVLRVCTVYCEGVIAYTPRVTERLCNMPVYVAVHYALYPYSCRISVY